MESEPEIIEVFIEEYYEFLELLKMEINNARSNQKTKVNEIFRVFHTLKGNSATLEYMRLSKLSSHYCDYFRNIQKQGKVDSKELIALEKCYTTLHKFISAIKSGKKGKRIKIAPIIKLLV